MHERRTVRCTRLRRPSAGWQRSVVAPSGPTEMHTHASMHGPAHRWVQCRRVCRLAQHAGDPTPLCSPPWTTGCWAIHRTGVDRTNGPHVVQDVFCAIRWFRSQPIAIKWLELNSSMIKSNQRLFCVNRIALVWVDHDQTVMDGSRLDWDSIFLLK